MNAQKNAVSAAVEAAYNAEQEKKYGKEVTFYKPDGYKEFNGQPKGKGLLTGGFTLGAGSAAGWGTITAAGKFTPKRDQFSSRAFRAIVGATAYAYWTYRSPEAKKSLPGPLIDDNGLTPAGVEMVKFRLGLSETCPTKSGRTPAKTTPSLARDFAELIAKGPEKSGKRAGIKEALNPIEWFSVTCRQREPEAK